MVVVLFSVPVAAQEMSEDVSPLEMAMIISMGCADIAIDHDRLPESGLLDEDGIDVEAITVSAVMRASIMRSAGIDLCALGKRQIDEGSASGLVLKELRG